MKKKLVMNFFADGENVPQLSKDPVSFQEINASLMFLDTNCRIEISVVECDENGNSIAGES